MEYALGRCKRPSIRQYSPPEIPVIGCDDFSTVKAARCWIHLGPWEWYVILARVDFSQRAVESSVTTSTSQAAITTTLASKEQLIEKYFEAEDAFNALQQKADA